MEFGIISLPPLDMGFSIFELRRLDERHHQFTLFLHPEIHPHTFVEPLQYTRHWELPWAQKHDSCQHAVLISSGRFAWPRWGLQGEHWCIPHCHTWLCSSSPGTELEKLRENHGEKDSEATECYTGSAERKGSGEWWGEEVRIYTGNCQLRETRTVSNG